MNDTMTTKEVAELLGVTEKTVIRYCENGLLTFYRIGRGRYNIDRQSVTNMIEHSKQESNFSNPNYTLNKEKEN